MAQNHSSFGSKILTAVATGGSVTFSKPYVGLFKTMPGADGSGGVEADYAEYVRIDASALGIEGSKIMGTPYSEAGTGEDAGKTISIVKNQEEVHWPACKTAAMDGKIVGWGLYQAKTGGTPMLWGEFPANDDGSTGREVPKDSIPIFYKSDFKLKVK